MSRELPEFHLDDLREGFAARGFIHRVVGPSLRRFTGPGQSEVLEWLHEHVGLNQDRWIYLTANEFLFKDPDDAFHFKMRWV